MVINFYHIGDYVTVLPLRKNDPVKYGIVHDIVTDVEGLYIVRCLDLKAYPNMLYAHTDRLRPAPIDVFLAEHGLWL